MHVDLRTGACVDLCADMCVDMGTGMHGDMYMNKYIYRRVWTCLKCAKRTCVDVYGHVHGQER